MQSMKSILLNLCAVESFRNADDEIQKPNHGWWSLNSGYFQDDGKSLESTLCFSSLFLFWDRW